MQQIRWYDAPSGTCARRLQQDAQAQQQAYSAPQDSSSSQVSSHDTSAHLYICFCFFNVAALRPQQLQCRVDSGMFLLLTLSDDKNTGLAGPPVLHCMGSGRHLITYRAHAGIAHTSYNFEG